VLKLTGILKLELAGSFPTWFKPGEQILN